MNGWRVTIERAQIARRFTNWQDAVSYLGERLRPELLNAFNGDCRNCATRAMADLTRWEALPPGTPFLAEVDGSDYELSEVPS